MIKKKCINQDFDDISHPVNTPDFGDREYREPN